MTKLLIHLFIKNKEALTDTTVRQKYGLLSGMTGIICNITLCILKFSAGIMTSSIAVTADAFNNLSDAGSSIVTLVGFKMANQPADEEHPFGHGRIEYISGFIIALIIMVMGIELLKTSVKKIVTPEIIQFDLYSLFIMITAVLIKFWMYSFNQFIGQKINSSALLATAKDSFSDMAATSTVIIGMIIFHFTGLNVDGYSGCIVALFILYTGFTALRDTLNPLLGQAPDKEYVENIKNYVLSYEPITGVHDLIVHNYGPGRCVISLHAEVPCTGDILQIHDTIDNIERNLKSKFQCIAVIHMDPIATEDQTVHKIHSDLDTILKNIDTRLTMHDFRMVPGITHTNLIFDIVVPYKFHLSDEFLLNELKQKIKLWNPQYHIIVTIDHSFA